MARKVFYSFHYEKDTWRTSQVRNIKVLEKNSPVDDNDWEKITKGGDAKIEQWIAEQLKGCSCTIVLIGAETAGRKWVQHEICKSWEKRMGLIGIHIHGLKDQNGKISTKGGNPFAKVKLPDSGTPLSEIVPCYDPTKESSQDTYADIERNLLTWVEEGIRKRQGK